MFAHGPAVLDRAQAYVRGSDAGKPRLAAKEIARLIKCEQLLSESARMMGEVTQQQVLQKKLQLHHDVMHLVEDDKDGTDALDVITIMKDLRAITATPEWVKHQE